MEYTTLDELKVYLGITDNTYDSVLQKIIKRVSLQFDRYIGRNLGVKTYEEYIDINNDNLIIVSNGPIVSVLNIEDLDGNYLEEKRINGNFIFLEEDFEGNLKIQYTAGYNSDDILDVEQACLEVCNDLWSQTPTTENDSNVKSKKIESLSISYFSKEEMRRGNVNWRETLNNYKTFTPLIA